MDAAITKPGHESVPREGDRLEAEVKRLSLLLDQLLVLARADAGALHPAIEPVDAGDPVDETFERWGSLAAEQAVRVVGDVRAEGSLPADPRLLRRVLDNLVDNALRNSPPRGTVTVALTRDDGLWAITVSAVVSGDIWTDQRM